MSANLLDLSGKIDALTIAIFDAIVTITIAIDILAQETGKHDRFRLAENMTRGTYSESFDENLLLLEALEQGLLDTNGL